MKTLVLMALVLLLSGCAAFQRVTNSDGLSSSERKARVAEERREAARLEQERKDKLCIGRTEDEVVIDQGAPTKIDTAGTFRVFHYFKDLGSSSQSIGSAGRIGYVVIARGATAVTNHHYLLKLYFKDGKCVKWDEEDQ